MNLPDELLDRLAQLGVDGTNVAVADGVDRLVARVEQSSPLAVSLWELGLSTDRLKGASIDRVREVAEEVTRRVTYLLEPIQPIEADHEACVVQLRSTQPSKTGPDDRGGVRSYYEALAKTGGSISLKRYEAPRGKLRRGVVMTLTHEVIGKLGEDFLASVD